MNENHQAQPTSSDHSPTDSYQVSEPPESPPPDEDDAGGDSNEYSLEYREVHPSPAHHSGRLPPLRPRYPFRTRGNDSQHICNQAVFDTRRVFVGRLVKGLAIDVLQRHFSAFGKLERILLPEDAATGKSKGYAFITFEDKASVVRVLQQPQIIAGTEVDCKPALMKDSSLNMNSKQLQPLGTLFKTNKIFIGGLPPSVTASALRSYFGQYGVISSCKIILDKVTGQSKGYGFCEYTEPSCVDRVMKNYDSHNLGGKWVQVKRAMPAAMREAFCQQLPTTAEPCAGDALHGDGLLGPGALYQKNLAPRPPPPPTVRKRSPVVEEEEGQLSSSASTRPMEDIVHKDAPPRPPHLFPPSRTSPDLSRTVIQSVAASALRCRRNRGEVKLTAPKHLGRVCSKKLGRRSRDQHQ